MRTMHVLLLLCTIAGLPAGLRAQEVDLYSRPLKLERSHDYDVLHYKIEIELAHETRSFAATTTIVMRPLRSAFDSCVLDAETFSVAGVHTLSGDPLRFRQSPGQLVVSFARPYDRTDTLSFMVSYLADSVDIDEVRYGMSAGYDLGLSFKPATDQHSPIINTLSFPTGARHWFPCYDHPNDKATTEVIATVDERFSVASNGMLISDQHDKLNHTRTFHWYQGLPHSTYLTVMVAGEYAIVRDSLDGLPIAYWVYPSQKENAQRTFGRTPDILRFFGRLFGVDYPWVKYDQITIPGIGGGAESTTATVISESAVIDAYAAEDYPTEWLVAHEAAHQWWGDYVTMRDWSETWMNESFATYYEYRWSRHSYGDDEGAWNLESKRRQYYREADTKYRRPIVFQRWEYPNQNFDSHTYPKGAAVLHMLRKELGEEEFDASVRHFLRTHPFVSVDTRDFRNAIQEATGRVMDRFFDQWVYAAGHPELEVDWSWVEDEKAVHLHVRQVQEQDEHVGLFTFPVDIGIQTDLGYSVERIEVTGEEETFVINSTAEPVFLRFDEDNALLARVHLKTSASEEVQELASTDVVGRRKAIERLAELLDEEGVVRALQQTGSHDAFWRVRELALRTLGEGRKGQEPYFRALCDDPVSGVRAGAVFALGRTGSAHTVPFLLSLFKRESSYRVRAEIVRAVGRLDGPHQREFLESAIRMRSHRSVIQRAAEESLEALDHN